MPWVGFFGEIGDMAPAWQAICQAAVSAAKEQPIKLPELPFVLPQS